LVLQERRKRIASAQLELTTRHSQSHSARPRATNSAIREGAEARIWSRLGRLQQIKRERAKEGQG
jgi:hypothetical protein